MSLWILHRSNENDVIQNNEKLALELRRKKITTDFLKDSNDFEEMYTDKDAAVYLRCDDFKNVEESIKELNSKNIPVIVENSFQSYCECRYNAIDEDLLGTVKRLLSYCLYYNKKRIAFFGADVNSVYDRTRLQILHYLYSAFNEDDIFYYSGSLDKCFDKFNKLKSNYDAIICADDFFAISLIEKLKYNDSEYLTERFVLGDSNTLISSVSKTPITTTACSAIDANNAVLEIYRSLKKFENSFYNQSIKLQSELYIRESTHNMPFPKDYCFKIDIQKSERKLKFPNISFKEEYSSLNSLKNIESILQKLDFIDYEIIYLRLLGKSISQISEKIFISQRVVNYRFNKMLKHTEFTKNEFMDALSNYISPKYLKEYVKQLEALK